jgi:hypothetical protein
MYIVGDNDASAEGTLGLGTGCALSVDQTGSFALWRHAQCHDRKLAQRHPGCGRAAHAVPPRYRRCAHDPRSCPNPLSQVSWRCGAGATGRRKYSLLFSCRSCSTRRPESTTSTRSAARPHRAHCRFSAQALWPARRSSPTTQKTSTCQSWRSST